MNRRQFLATAAPAIAACSGLAALAHTAPPQHGARLYSRPSYARWDGKLTITAPAGSPCSVCLADGTRVDLEPGESRTFTAVLPKTGNILALT
jgi:hypothetical protein